MTEPERPRGGGSANAAGDILRPQSIPPEPPGQAARRHTGRRPDSPQWLAAKAAGDEAELALANWFMARGWRAYLTPGQGDIDVLVQCFFEVKHDMQAERTGNVAIETAYRGKPSGIITSRADFWAIVVGNQAFVAETPKLRATVLKGSFTEVRGGDGGASRVRLVPLDKLRAMECVKRIELGSVPA